VSLAAIAKPTVCIDCSPLLMRSAGVKTYLYHWLSALQKACPESIHTFLAPGNLEELSHRAGPYYYPRQILTLLALNQLPEFLAKHIVPRCDIFHASNILLRTPASSQLSATLHDLTTWIMPECHRDRVVAADKAFADQVLRRAAGVISISENTKRDAIQILGLAPEKLHVIYPGVSDRYFAIGEREIASAASFCGLHTPYFLFVGTIEPRKNLDTLLTAWDSLPLEFRGQYELLIVGMPGWKSDATMRRIRAASHSGVVRYLGYTPGSVLAGLIAGATALVYPSLYEGFGIPVAEAMAAGCPAITSNNSSLPEVTAGAALLIDPLSATEIAAAILRMGESESLRAGLRTAGLKQSARFTWDAAAEASLRYFAEIA
jgi:glycosyltransferase involved in cell wall biosynthesis